jgi:hypothetical protein
MEISHPVYTSYSTEPYQTDWEIYVEQLIESGRLRELWMRSLDEEKTEEYLRQYFDVFILDDIEDVQIRELLGWDDA